MSQLKIPFTRKLVLGREGVNLIILVLYNKLWYSDCVLEEVTISCQHLELSMSLKIAGGSQKTHLEVEFENVFFMESISKVKQTTKLKKG